MVKKSKSHVKESRVILHADLNSFYANVECLYQPELWHKPVVVCGDPENRHGIVLAKNQPAKHYKIKTGEAIWQARQKCPGLICLPADYDKYLTYSHLMRELLADYTSQIEPFGLDEAWIDVTGTVHLYGDGRRIADEIRSRVTRELGLYCSVGVSFNKIFAKLGSDMRKPDATTVIDPVYFREVVWPLPVSELLYAGPATTKKLARVGVRTIGALAAMRQEDIERMLGKWGGVLWSYANGMDQSPVMQEHEHHVIKSVGNSTTTPRDLENETDVRLIVFVLAESVAARLRQYGFKGKTVQIYIRDNLLRSFERQGKLYRPSDLAKEISDKAMALFRQHYDWQTPIRSLGVRACDLVAAHDLTQLSWLTDEQWRQRQKKLEETIDIIRSRYGYYSIQRGLMLADKPLSGFNPKEEHIIHPVAFYHD